jgi:DNA-binding MarR family transcriptional regulator
MTAPQTVLAASDELSQLAEALERAASWVRRTTPRAEWSLTAATTLDTLGREGPQRVSDLTAREAISQPGMTGLVARLAAAGLVERGPDPTDGRATLVSITKTGRDWLARRHAVRAQRVAAQLRRLPEGDRSALMAATAALTNLAAQDPEAAQDPGEGEFL